MTSLRPRQIQAIADVRAAYRAGYRAPVLVAPTGFGKTHTTAEIVRAAVAKGQSVWFMAHLKEILEATSAKLATEGIRHGLIMAGYPANKVEPVQVVSVQTVVRRLDRYKPPGLLIIDEAHLAVAETYRKVIAGLGNPYLLLLTATPERLDGRGLGEVADIIVPTCSTQDLIDEGLLADIRYYAPSNIDLSGVRKTAGEFNAKDVEAVVDKPKLVGDAVSHWLKVARGRPTIRFCVSIKHAEHMAEQFRQAGVRSVAVSGDTDTEERRRALDDLKNGRVEVVTNCALWVAGVDAPNVSCIGLDMPTNSLTKFLQSVGRGLRTHPGKDDCIVLDHGGNIARHGHPADLREWTLEGTRGLNAKKRDPDDISVKTCPMCFTVMKSQSSECRTCGHHFAPKPREIEVVDGDLKEIERAREIRQARVEQGMARTLEELVNIGRLRGMKRPELWARHVIRARGNHEVRR